MPACGAGACDAPARAPRGGHARDRRAPRLADRRAAADDRVRRMLPAKRGVMRVIGRWLVSGFKDGTLGLVREYDREQVSKEGLLLINGATSKQLVSALSRAAPACATRRLPKTPARCVLVHGTFSKTASPVDGFGPEFIAWARQHYRVVLGLDHWTLSKTPEDNAQAPGRRAARVQSRLLEARQHRRDHPQPRRSRRAFVLRAARPLPTPCGNLIFLGTPNCGTDLANPKNWGIARRPARQHDRRRRRRALRPAGRSARAARRARAW